MEFFSGPVALFKNPVSHRQVDYDDPTEASEVVLLADLLLRILIGLWPPLHPLFRHPSRTDFPQAPGCYRAGVTVSCKAARAFNSMSWLLSD